MKMDELRKAALTEPNERFVVFMESNGQDIPVIETKGGSTFASVDRQTVVDKLIESKSLKVEFSHTHPLAYAHTLKKADTYAAEKKDGTVAGYVIPPSMEDIRNLIIAADYFKEMGVEVKSSVIEPGGKWEFTADLNNEFVKAMARFNNEAMDSAWKSLSKEDIAILGKEAANFKGIDPRLYIDKLSGSSESKAALEKILNIWQSKGEEFLLKFQDNDLNNLVLMQDQITAETDIGKKKKMIEQYIESARKKGINMRYEPFSK